MDKIEIHADGTVKLPTPGNMKVTVEMTEGMFEEFLQFRRDKEIYDNLIFAIPPNNIKSVAKKIGEPTKELERVEICDNAAFWSFDRKKYNKAAWWKKTASTGIAEMITIRTANTLRKIISI